MANVTTEAVYDALATVIDPELHMNIVDLGLIYDVKVNENDEVHVVMTLTSMGCPLGDTIARNCEAAVLGLDGVKDALIEIVFEPPWNLNMLSDYAKDKLGIG